MHCCHRWRMPQRSAFIAFGNRLKGCSTPSFVLRSGGSQHTSYTVRPAQSADVPRLAVVEQLCGEFSAHWSTSEIEEELGKNISHVLVAADINSNEVLGYIVGWLIAGELQVLELAVDPTHQSKGIGSALLTGIMQQCRCDEVVLEVKAHNERAIQLYKRHEFKEVGLRRKYYEDGSDALLMSRSNPQLSDSLR